MLHSPDLHSAGTQPRPAQNAARPADAFAPGPGFGFGVAYSAPAGTGTAPARLSQAATSVELARVKRIMHERSLRARHFASELFADPAWDILLGLARAEMEHRRTTVSQLCLEAAVPMTTALRWINSMTRDGTLSRRPDKFDRRRVYIELSCASSQAMMTYLSDVQI
jgi:DNA-binding MarR family transcriptional regulator